MTSAGEPPQSSTARRLRTRYTTAGEWSGAGGERGVSGGTRLCVVLISNGMACRINMRYLGSLATMAEAVEVSRGMPRFFRQLCETEMVARAAKHILGKILVPLSPSPRSPSPRSSSPHPLPPYALPLHALPPHAHPPSPHSPSFSPPFPPPPPPPPQRAVVSAYR